MTFAPVTLVVVPLNAVTAQPVGAVVGKVITIVDVPVVVAVTKPALALLPVPIVAPVQVVAALDATSVPSNCVFFNASAMIAPATP
jgi:hypothetical protein